MPNLVVLEIKNYELKKDDAKAIGKYLGMHPKLAELSLCDTNLSTECSKEIADGLMRAKGIRVLRLAGNAELDSSHILYNLAFSARITTIDLTGSGTEIGSVTPT